MSRDGSLERQNGNLWVNHTALKSIRKLGKVASLTVSPGVDNKLTLKYGGSVQSWTFTISSRSKFAKVRGRQKVVVRPTSATKAFLESMSATEVFACENGTLFFHQDKNFFLAIGHTSRLPVKLETRSPSMLLVSWVANRPAIGSRHAVSLYHSELGSYKTLRVDTTTRSHYRFTALESCSPYVACVAIVGTRSFTCLSSITDPDIPRDFEVTSWNSSSISLAWNCPENQKFSLFLLTAFYLNGTDHTLEEVLSWHKGDNFEFILSDLQPCSRVKFGLQTVCQAGTESRYSRMVLSDGNSEHSRIEAVSQTSFGPHSYTLSWKVRNTSSISMFRVHHEGALQGTTLLTNYTVGGLLPCQQYQAKVEALCGDGVLMSAKTVAAHTGPRHVSHLRNRSDDSTTPHQAVAFLYEMSPENGSSLQDSRVNNQEEGKTYILEVWEECDGRRASQRSPVWLEGADSSSELLVRALPAPDVELQLDISSMGLTMVVPWSLHPELLDDTSEPRAEMGKIFKDKLQELLKDFRQPVRVELVTFEPADEPDKTSIQFMSLDASSTVPLPVKEQLDYIRSLNASNIAVRDGVIHWVGPDLCTSSKQTVCPRNALCLNTLDSYTCVCQHGYYDVSSVIKAPAVSHPVCHEKGLFSQCMAKLSGGIAKPYLTSYMGGKVDVKLNDGRCSVNESGLFYYFRTSRKVSECGTQMRVNKTHIDFQNILTVTLSREQTISRRDLKVVWKCVYPRHYVSYAQVNVDMEWLTSIALVEFNSSLQLALTMSLHSDGSYTHRYRDAIALGLDDTLFFQVALETNISFVSDLLLQVESCWATESTDPEDAVQGVLLQNGCPVDTTFHWLSVNGLAQKGRFSVQVFTMPQGLPLYFHCLTNICEHEEDCTKNCTSPQRTKRSVSRTDRGGKRAAVVSAGPVVVSEMKSGVAPSNWAEHVTLLSIVAGSIGILGVTVLSVSATKAIMTYYDQLRLQ
ncbi:uncharacterized protein [Pempheris klunzingeri]|uniref:uncharacterized protein n=1 Tax=Pempheris klunzingeri TaxID=3127111 RepID=UPI0039812A4E